MIKIRRSEDRGAANYGWLDTKHTFSFNNYYDPQFMGFRDLRVINEDYITPAQGFPKHGHRDMEILTYVVSGDLSHKDSLGNAATIRPNEVQRMTAGTGVQHSEHSSQTEETHLLQIWILPEKENIEPSYEQVYFPPEEKSGKLKLVASRGGGGGSVHINQDVLLYDAILAKGDEIEYKLPKNRHAWLQMIKGKIKLNSEVLNAGDGAAISEEEILQINSLADETEFLLFDLK